MNSDGQLSDVVEKEVARKRRAGLITELAKAENRAVVRGEADPTVGRLRSELGRLLGVLGEIAEPPSIDTPSPTTHPSPIPPVAGVQPDLFPSPDPAPARVVADEVEALRVRLLELTTRLEAAEYELMVLRAQRAQHHAAQTAAAVAPPAPVEQREVLKLDVGLDIAAEMDAVEYELREVARMDAEEEVRPSAVVRHLVTEYRERALRVRDLEKKLAIDQEDDELLRFDPGSDLLIRPYRQLRLVA